MLQNKLRIPGFMLAMPVAWLLASGCAQRHERIAKSIELTEPFPERWSDHLMEIVADFLL